MTEFKGNANYICEEKECNSTFDTLSKIECHMMTAHNLMPATQEDFASFDTICTFLGTQATRGASNSLNSGGWGGGPLVFLAIQQEQLSACNYTCLP